MIKKYTTNINKKIYLKEEILLETKKKTNNKIEIFPDNEISTFLGFGSAMTESSGYNYQKLSAKNMLFTT